MSNVVAINKLSAERIEEMQKAAAEQAIQQAIEHPDVQNALVSKVIEVINGMSAWDICYHGKLNEAIAPAICSDAVKPHAEAAAIRCLASDRADNFIFEYLSQALAERIKLEVKQ